MVYSLKQNAVTYFLLEVMVENNIKGTMFVFIFVCGIGLENWSGKFPYDKDPTSTVIVIRKTDHSHNTKETVKNVDSHSFTVPPLKGWH